MFLLKPRRQIQFILPRPLLLGSPSQSPLHHLSITRQFEYLKPPSQSPWPSHRQKLHLNQSLRRQYQGRLSPSPKKYTAL